MHVESAPLEMPPPLLPQQVQYDYNRDVSNRAKERVRYGNSDGLTGIAALINLTVVLGYIFTDGNMVALKAYLASLLILLAVVLVLVSRERRKITKDSPETVRTLLIANEGLTFRSSGEVSFAEWSHFREVRLFPDFAIFYRYNQSQPVAVPMGALGEALTKIIKHRVTEAGGKVVTPIRRVSQTIRRLFVRVMCVILVMAFVGWSIVGKPDDYVRFDKMRMDELVKQVRKTPFLGTVEFHWREEWDAHFEMNTDNEFHWGGITSPKLLTAADGAGYQVWADRGNDQKLKVVVVTEYKEPGGAAGYAYSDTDLQPEKNKVGQVVLAVPGPVDKPVNQMPIADRWWKVVEVEDGDADSGTTKTEWTTTWKLP